MRLRSRPMYVLFRYGIQTFYTAIIIIMPTKMAKGTEHDLRH